MISAHIHILKKRFLKMKNITMREPLVLINHLMSGSDMKTSHLSNQDPAKDLELIPNTQMIEKLRNLQTRRKTMLETPENGKHLFKIYRFIDPCVFFLIIFYYTLRRTNLFKDYFLKTFNGKEAGTTFRLN